MERRKYNTTLCATWLRSGPHHLEKLHAQGWVKGLSFLPSQIRVLPSNERDPFHIKFKIIRIMPFNSLLK